MQLYLLDGAKLRDMRVAAGLSQEELSAKVGQRRGWVSELEQQTRIHVLELFMHKLSGVFGVGIKDFSTHPEPPNPPTAPEAQKLDVAKMRALREEAMISPEELDARAEIESGSVAGAEEQGEWEDVRASVDVIWKLANALEVSPTILLKR